MRSIAPPSRRRRNSRLVVLLACVTARVAAADVFTVTTTLDAGSGSLREAIAAANAHTNIDTGAPDLAPKHKLEQASW